VELFHVRPIFFFFFFVSPVGLKTGCSLNALVFFWIIAPGTPPISSSSNSTHLAQTLHPSRLTLSSAFFKGRTIIQTMTAEEKFLSIISGHDSLKLIKETAGDEDSYILQARCWSPTVTLVQEISVFLQQTQMIQKIRFFFFFFLPSYPILFTAIHSPT
jgi:hypothetical protein